MNARVDDDEPGHWPWGTGPRYYAEDDDSDRVDLDPTGDHVADGWWTCHKDTREGDLVLLYRTKPKMDIAEIKADPVLDRWNAKNSRFQRRAFRIERGIGDHLITRLVEDPTQIEEKLTWAKRLHTLEAEIEAKLESEPERLSVLGDLCRFARQHRCLNGGRADLVFKDKRSKRYVVVEVKRGLVGRSAVAQALSYRASVGAEFPVGGELPLGVVVGERLDNEAAGMIEDDDRLQFVSLRDLGFPPVRA